MSSNAGNAGSVTMYTAASGNLPATVGADCDAPPGDSSPERAAVDPATSKLYFATGNPDGFASAGNA